MHETYRSLAELIICERLREAAEWRLAEQAARSRNSSGLGGRLRRLLGGDPGQPAVAAGALSADRPTCA